MHIVFNLTIIIVTVISIIFILKKVFLNKNMFSKTQNLTLYHEIKLHWEKSSYIIPNYSIVKNINTEYHTGEYYYIEQSINEHSINEKCFLGLFKLTGIKRDHFLFKSEKSHHKSKLEEYSNLNSLEISLNIYSKENYQKENNYVNCLNWTEIKNHNYSEKIDAKYFGKVLWQDKNTNYIILKNKKCMTISIHKYFKIESFNQEIAYLNFNKVKNIIELCPKKDGITSIILYPSDGSQKYIQNIISEINPSKIRQRKQILKFEKFKLNSQKILPGWR